MLCKRLEVYSYIVIVDNVLDLKAIMLKANNGVIML